MTIMAIKKHYINQSKEDQFTIWFITLVLAIVGYSWLKGIVVSMLVKLYELFIQHAAGR